MTTRRMIIVCHLFLHCLVETLTAIPQNKILYRETGVVEGKCVASHLCVTPRHLSNGPVSTCLRAACLGFAIQGETGKVAMTTVVWWLPIGNWRIYLQDGITPLGKLIIIIISPL